ncbi:MAG TPA: RNA polymerase subunit sigma-24 [Firmicutes bacterium]|jgi:RNA polymerase sigma factor (sigma-70 family)|nr:RNA polymerase subunit sigma-24 [Bacillota bacterium]
MALMERQTEIVDFFAKEQNHLHDYVRSRLADISEMDIEDLLQDLFINLFNKADISLHIENLAAYIYRSIQNRIIDYLRKKKKTTSLDEIIVQADGKTLNDKVFDPDSDVEKALDRQELHEKLYEAINSLEPKQRAVWVATELDEYSFSELAQMWGEPMGTLLARKHRAVKKLQALLKDYR